jgi:hypothetical protein
MIYLHSVYLTHLVITVPFWFVRLRIVIDFAMAKEARSIVLHSLRYVNRKHRRDST